MNITSVQMPQRRQQSDSLAQIGDVLRIIQAGFGIRTDYQQGKLNELKLKEAEKEARKQEGIFTPEQAGQEFRVTADSPYFNEAIPGRIEKKTHGAKPSYEDFYYVPKDRIERLNMVQNIDETKKKSLLEADYAKGRISPRDIANSLDIKYQEEKPAGKGYVFRWDIDPSTGKQVSRWVLPNAAASYYANQERAAIDMGKTQQGYKTKLAESYEKIAPALGALKRLDASIKSDDKNARIPGADELISALNKPAAMQFFNSGEVWKDPNTVNKFIQNAGPEARKLWQDILDYMNEVLLAKSGQAVSENEYNRQVQALGSTAWSSPEALKNGLKNAKANFYTMIRYKESPYYENGNASQVLLDYRKSPGAISSDDPFFNALKTYKNKSDSDSYIKRLDEMNK